VEGACRVSYSRDQLLSLRLADLKGCQMIYVHGLLSHRPPGPCREDAGGRQKHRLQDVTWLLLLRLGVTWPRSRFRYPSYLATGYPSSAYAQAGKHTHL